MGHLRCIFVALDLKGSERGSKLGPVANNGEIIASWRQSLGMWPRNFRPCGRQRALSAWGLLSVFPLLWVLWGQKGGQSWVI